MAEDDTHGNPQSPHLNTLLSKLRPFQRTAFEFAVHGTLPSDGKDVGNRAAVHAKRGDGDGKKDSTQVAGAGTGRILLGDEMGLGCVLYLTLLLPRQPHARFISAHTTPTLTRRDDHLHNIGKR